MLELSVEVRCLRLKWSRKKIFQAKETDIKKKKKPTQVRLWCSLKAPASRVCT